MVIEVDRAGLLGRLIFLVASTWPFHLWRSIFSVAHREFVSGLTVDIRLDRFLFQVFAPQLLLLARFGKAEEIASFVVLIG